MGHACPACKEPVYGKLDTKRYCNKRCRFRYNKRKEKQLKIRCENLDQFEKKNFEIMSFLVGATKSYFKADLDLLRSKGFRTSKFCSKGFVKGIPVFIIEQYAFYVKNLEVHIHLLAQADDFLDGVEERWKLDFPNAEEELLDDDNLSMKVLGVKLKEYLKIHQPQSEVMEELRRKMAKWAIWVFGIWRI